MLSIDHDNTLMCLFFWNVNFENFTMPLIKLDFCVWFWVILTKSCVIWRFQNQKSIFGELPIGEYDVFDSGEVNFLCCSVHFFEFKKFEFDFFCWTQGKCLPLQLSIFKLSCKISIFTTKKKLALSSLFLSSLSLRLFAASAALSHDALSLSRNLLRSSLSTLYLYLSLSLSLSLWKKIMNLCRCVLWVFCVTAKRERNFFFTHSCRKSLFSHRRRLTIESLYSTCICSSVSLSLWL